MKILHVYHIYPAFFGGVSRVVYEITKELVKKGYNVSVLTTNAYFNGRQEFNNVDVNVFRFNLFFPYLAKRNITVPDIDFALWVKRMVKSFNCIHIHGLRNLYTIFIHDYARKHDVPYVLQAHGSLPRIGKTSFKWLYDTLFGYRLLRDASKLIALTRIEAEQYKSMGVPEEKIAIIPNGIDLSKYTELPPKGSFKKKFNIPEDKRIILYLGRIHKTKGIDFLVKAYAHLLNEMKIKDTVLVIAGPDDGYLKEVKELTATLGISKNVLFTGLLSEKDKIAAYDANIVVNVEPINVYGLVPLEAAACGTPVIVSKGNAIKDIIHEGKFGFSVEYGDVISLATMLQKILDDEELAKSLGRNGRNFVFNKFSWAKIVERLENVYKNVIKIN